MSKQVRQLAAIMFTDIVGYTALMNKNETAAAAIRRRHRAVFQREHQAISGEIIQYYGDGTLSAFRSAVEAVECAIKMQQEFQSGGVVPLRIGLHLGDIVFDEKSRGLSGGNRSPGIRTQRHRLYRRPGSAIYGFGDYEKAFDHLEKAVEYRIGSIMMVKSYHMLKPLFNQSRFARIEQMIGEVPVMDH